MTGRLKISRHAALALAAGLVALCGFAVAPAHAQGTTIYGFAAPPSAQANRVYSVNRRTGEVSACQFERPEGSNIGITRCFAQGEGAGTQKPGTYSLVSTHYAGETGIFRANEETGEMSICYVREIAQAGGAPQPTILCTPQAR